MQAVMTPALAYLINVGKEAVYGAFDKAKLLGALGEADSFVEDFVTLYDFLAPAIYYDEETTEVHHYMRSTLLKLKEVLADLRKTVEKERTFELNPVLHKLEEVAGKLMAAARELKDMEKEETVESPLPLVNTAIRTAFNVAKQSEKKELLIPLIPPLVGLVTRLEQDINRFESLHGDEEKCVATARKLINDMKEGIGALASFIKEEKPHYLADGLRLLKYPSRNLYVVLRAMDRVARRKSDFSFIPALEEFHGVYLGWKEGKVPEEILRGSIDSLKFLAALYHDTHSGIKRFPFFYVLSSQWSAAQIIRTQFEQFFTAFVKEVEGHSRSLDLPGLRQNFEHYSRVLEKLIMAMEQEIEKVADAPYMEELKELIGRVLAGNLVLEYFAERVQSLAQSHQMVLDEFKAARGLSSSPPEVREVCELLKLQGQGLDEILLYLEDSEEKHLYGGLAKIEKALPRLVEIQKSIRVGVQEKIRKGKAMKPICIRCGKENSPGARTCKGCQAMLPFMVDDSAAADMMDEETGSPLNIARIEEAVTRFETGSLSAPDLSRELKSYLNKLEGIKSDFNARVLGPLKASQNSDIREWSALFSRNVQAMEEGLEMMLLFQENPEFLYRGMQAFAAPASELASIRQMVRGAR